MTDENMLRDLIRRAQDIAIIELTIKRDYKRGYGDVRDDIKKFLELELTNDERSMVDENPLVLAPIISVDLMQGAPQLTFKVGDPKLGHPAAPYREWMQAWFTFQVILSDYSPDITELYEENEPSQTEVPSATHYLVNSVAYIHEQHGSSVATEFIERLWANRWLYSAPACAALLRQVSDAADMDDSANAASRSIDDLKARLDKLRSDAVDLDEWIEGLYLMAPWLFLAMQLNEYGVGLSDQESQSRFLSEAFADLGTYLLTVSTLNFKHLTFLEDETRDGATARQVRRRLLYLAKARIFFPNFWAEAATSFVQDPSPALAEALNRYDYRHAVSCEITYLPEAHGAPIEWYRTQPTLG